MNEPIHPARSMSFADLTAGLRRARELGFVHRRVDDTGGLQLFIYTTRCVYEDGWDEFSLMARGLILDEAAGDDMDAIRRDLPEEFWKDFDDIVRLLRANIAAIETRVADFHASVSHLSDKELGLSLASMPMDMKPYVFGYRKFGPITGKSRESLMRSIRPTGNILAGYAPSYAMGRILEDAAS